MKPGAAKAETSEVEAKETAASAGETKTEAKAEPAKKEGATEPEEKKTDQQTIDELLARYKASGGDVDSLKYKGKGKGKVRGGGRGLIGGMSSSNIAMFVALAGMLITAVMNQNEGEGRMQVETLEQTLFKTVISPKSGFSLGGPNGRQTDWVVFFYKPYCGACRRVRPFFHALARTTNHTQYLRFGEIDCVKYRPLCNHAGAKAQPMIKIYSANAPDQHPYQPLPEPLAEDAQQQTPVAKKKKATSAEAEFDFSATTDAQAAEGEVAALTPKKQGRYDFHRRPVATWQGVLIAYEIMQWFAQNQARGVIRPHVKWANDEALAKEMQLFKMSGDAQHDQAVTKRSKDPQAYLQAVDVAWRMGLHDAVFQRHETLEGERLAAMLEWLDALGYALPSKVSREMADKFRERISQREVWKRAGFVKALDANGIREPGELEWGRVKACAPRGPEAAGTGGYPCALWMLFHSLLANSDRRAAPHVLKAVRGWTVNFFGCTDCAMHFAELWRDARGDDAQDSFESAIWLWKAHNAVSSRLADEDADAAPFKQAWPAQKQCDLCFKDPAKEPDAAIAPYAEDYIYQYLQEVYCYASDTFVCAAFDDPSRHAN